LVEVTPTLWYRSKP